MCYFTHLRPPEQILGCTFFAGQAESTAHVKHSQTLMKLLNTYDDRDEAEAAAEKLSGEKRLASERDATVVIYNLFGIPSWGNFHRLDMYNLGELKNLLDKRNTWQPGEQARHAEILATLKTVAKNYAIEIPAHWQ
ncbi:hypothetical protein B479_23085 [Pseudomonas putida HB3267]|nr:hypothetical protein B479_23085 [Pseudomonas putida HB3267]